MNKSRARRRRNPAPASDDVMWSLMQAAHAVESQLEEALAQVELSGAKLAALTQLVEADEPVPLGELAARCACVRSNITQLVDRLEADKLVRRVDDPADRRSRMLTLTREGRSLLARAVPIWKRTHVHVEHGLAGADPGLLRRDLKTLSSC